MIEAKKPTVQRSIFAQWREGVVGRCHFPWLTLRRMVFVLASAVAVWVHVAEASIPLTVKCRCERADADRDIGSKTETLWIFVLDHSGSMGNHRDAYSIKRGMGSGLRWTALKDSFEETVQSIPIGASVQVPPVPRYRWRDWICLRNGQCRLEQLQGALCQHQGDCAGGQGVGPAARREAACHP